ncbi:MAG: hypothetical protein NTY81_02080 [Candidatus Staskawiczbacteria bacterium]|nr:hypothetical protein [Candidatus Staskawiczbacteria bacterium]
MDKLSERIIIFVGLPLLALGNLALTFAMPTTAMKLTYLEFGLACSVCIGLGIANIITNSRHEEKLEWFVRPVAAFGLVMAANTAALYFLG